MSTIILPDRFSKQPKIKRPTPAQVRAAREAERLTQAQAAALIHVAVESWRNYERDAAATNARPIPLGLWELFCLKVGRRTLRGPADDALGDQQAQPPAPAPALFRRPGA